MTSQERLKILQEESRQPHPGVFLVGRNTLELTTEPLPETTDDEAFIITASLIYSRCTSDTKAIQQFREHARIPNDATRIALGHETVHLVLEAPSGSGVKPGDLVVITPGHASEPIDPLTFAPDPRGVLCALGYSYRYFGALRMYNRVPVSAIEVVASNGFGDLFCKIPHDSPASLSSLAHAEPYACCAGTNHNIFFRDPEGTFSYDVPPRSILAYLGGTARMAMINLTIVAQVDDSELPRVVVITGSPAKLDELDTFTLIRDLRKRGVRVNMIDRNASDIIARLTEHGRPDVVWTNYPAQDVYDQAVAIITPGGNINSYAGASDPDVGFQMRLGRVPPFPDLDTEAAAQIQQMHHNVALTAPERIGGLKPGGVAAFIGFDDDTSRLQAYLRAVPRGHRIHIPEPDSLQGARETIQSRELIIEIAPVGLNDVFIARTGPDAAACYSQLEPNLARSAAVNFVRGDTELFIHSSLTHYTTRHQICGPTIPYTMTNTSEPRSEDLAEQALHPIDFDWLVRRVCGLDHAIEMIDDLTARQPFGSFMCFIELPDLPYVDVGSASFKEAAAHPDLSERARDGLERAAAELETNGETWSKRVETLLYAAYDIPHPLA
ncbi:MAG: hypothetical protein O2923_06015 [Verrucomicrobia bacterium]|nr:hypothetical protein [Verrucomicrobiota bacterium]MDA1086302.1 hypothetical protein [Verrucomicrobiota bacterium]